MRAYALLLLSAVAFSLSGLFTREATAGAAISLWAIVFWRNLFGLAGLALVTALHSRARLHDLRPWGWATVLLGALATLFYIAALTRTSVANVAIIYATAPLMALLVARAWLHEALTRASLIASGLALAGAAVTVAGSLGGGTARGDALALAMTFAFALTTVFARRHGAFPALLGTTLMCVLTALTTLPLAWFAGASLAVSWTATVWLAGFGIATMAVAMPCYLAGVRHVPAGPAMVISALEMPMAPLWVLAAFGEVPRTASIVGGVLVAAAVLLQVRGAPDAP